MPARKQKEKFAKHLEKLKDLADSLSIAAIRDQSLHAAAKEILEHYRNITMEDGVKDKLSKFLLTTTTWVQVNWTSDDEE